MRKIQIAAGCLALGLIASVASIGQAASYTDPAQAFNRLMLEKNGSNGGYVRIGAYNVIGSPYIYADRYPGSYYFQGEKDAGNKIAYNAYSQKLEIFPPNSGGKNAFKTNAEVDSFVLKPTISDAPAELYFISAKVLGSKEDFFLQRIHSGNRFVLYKKYKASLAIASSNYVDANLRQFDLEAEYYYYDNTAKALKPIKPSAKAVKKEFKPVKDDIDTVVADIDFSNPEAGLTKVFEALN